MNQVIVGLWGPAGVGKDTVADCLGWPKASFAAALKESCRPKFEKLGLDITKREDKEKGRHILVDEGAGKRKVDPLYWVKRLKRPDYPKFTIADVRYLNEINYVTIQGGVVYELVRPGFEPANAEENRSFKEIRDYCRDMGITIPVIHNSTPQLAANLIREDLRKRAGSIYEATLT